MSAARDVLQFQAAFASPAARRLPRLLSRREARVALRLQAGREARAGEVARIAARGWLEGVRLRAASLDLAPCWAEPEPYYPAPRLLELDHGPASGTPVGEWMARRERHFAAHGITEIRRLA